MKTKTILPYLLLSLVFHATLLYFGIKRAQEDKPKEKKQVVQVSFIHLSPNPKPKKEKQIISLPRANKEIPKEDAHLSEENNSVAEETIARSANSTGEKDGNVSQPNPSGEGVNLFPQGAISDVARDLSGTGGNSNNGDYIEGVKGGSETALNTVEFKFASFFNRVKKDISIELHVSENQFFFCCTFFRDTKSYKKIQLLKIIYRITPLDA